MEINKKEVTQNSEVSVSITSNPETLSTSPETPILYGEPENVQFSKIEIPKFSESNVSYNREIVNYGVDNLFPLKVVDINRESPINSAIVTSTAKMVSGEALECYSNNTLISDNTELRLFTKRVNKRESLHQIVKKTAYDYKLFGGYAWNIIWNKARTKVAEIYHVDFSTIRSGLANMNGDVGYYYFSNDWSNPRKISNKPVKIKSFDPFDRTEASQLLYFRPYNPATLFYPLPDWSIKAAMLNSKILDFQLSAIENNFQPGLWVSMHAGEPKDPQMRRAFRNRIRAFYEGNSKAGRSIITYSESREKAPEIKPIPVSDIDKQWIAVWEQNRDTVLVANRVTSGSIVGVAKPGMLGTTQEMRDASELFYNNVIREYQQNITVTIDEILEINFGVEIQTSITNSQPLKFSFSENMLSQLLTKSEARELISYPPLKEGEVTNTNDGTTISNQMPKENKKPTNPHD